MISDLDRRYIAGMPVFTSEHMCKKMTETIDRTWRERLFSWPWRPWVTQRMSIYFVPDEEVMMLDNKLIMHPATYARFRELVVGGLG